jgi:hypothetical protein
MLIINLASGSVRTIMAIDHAFPWEGAPPPVPLFSTYVVEYPLNVELFTLVDLRLREGFLLAEVHCGTRPPPVNKPPTPVSSTHPSPVVASANPHRESTAILGTPHIQGLYLPLDFLN